MKGGHDPILPWPAQFDVRMTFAAANGPTERSVTVPIMFTQHSRIIHSSGESQEFPAVITLNLLGGFL